MKKVFHLFCITCLILPVLTFGQALDCKKFREGNFKSTIPGYMSFTMNRVGTKQTEISDKGMKMIYDVKWINDCTYTLKPLKEYADRYKLPANALITVVIIKTTKNSYFQTSSSNFVAQKFSSEIIKTN